MQFKIRQSDLSDLLFLDHLEQVSFSENQRNSKQNIRLSLISSFQEVRIIEAVEKANKPVGAIVFFMYKKSLRIYSVSVLPEYRNSGAGSALLNYAIEFAGIKKYLRIILEADATNSALIEWYKKKGFKPYTTVSDYYAPGLDCVKMQLDINTTNNSGKKRNLIVVNHPKSFLISDVNAKIISVKEFISNQEYHVDTNFRVFNLCGSYQYQSYGYYVSLLASARGQRVIPNVATIRDLNNIYVIRSLTEEINELLTLALGKIKTNNFQLNIYFGHTNIRGFKKLAMKLFQLFEIPLFSVHFIKDGLWIIKKIQPLNVSKLNETELTFVNEFAREYFNKRRFNKTRITSYIYDLAILVNLDEKTPPSCPDALKKFKKAANKKGIYVEFITKNDINKINEFDALFIRETTSVNNHTYELSRYAYAEGLVVIDDPWSILRCSNKIYQNELFRHNKILTPNTIPLTKNLFHPEDLAAFNFPMVIKQPDSAFSVGITKVNNKEEAVIALNDLFKKTDMVICQEFMYSDFDWRIGILNNTPIFACKYYMTQGHWQIYNWQGEEEERVGDSETLPVSEVPPLVLKTAQKAASLIGDGLYGVDLKEINGNVYVIEINDNPNIDADVEDEVLKDKLYEIIIDSFLKRIEISKNIIR